MCKLMQEKVRKKRSKVLMPNKTSDTELSKNTATKTDVHITVTFRQLLLDALAQQPGLHPLFAHKKIKFAFVFLSSLTKY